MILEHTLKGEQIQFADPLTSMTGKGRFYKPYIVIKDHAGEKFYLSYENLKKILASMEFDVDKKKVRKHLIPLIPNKAI